MTAPKLSTTEYAVLGLLDRRPSHGFALAKELAAGSEVGRVFTVRRPLVYRALDRLVDEGLAEPVTTERGPSGPQRVIHRITPEGRRRLRRWLAEPVEHVRDLRLEFLLKLALLHIAGRPPLELVRAQRVALDATLRALDTGDGREDHDPIELWRRHNATATAAYLDRLESLYS